MTADRAEMRRRAEDRRVSFRLWTGPPKTKEPGPTVPPVEAQLDLFKSSTASNTEARRSRQAHNAEALFRPTRHGGAR